MPIFRRSKALLLHLVYIGLVLLDVVGSGCGALPTTSNKTRPKYAKYSNKAFVLLKMSIMIPETC